MTKIAQEEEGVLQVFSCAHCGSTAEFLHYGKEKDLVKIKDQIQQYHDKIFH